MVKDRKGVTEGWKRGIKVEGEREKDWSTAGGTGKDGKNEGDY